MKHNADKQTAAGVVKPGVSGKGVRECCRLSVKKLSDEVGPGGGFVLANGSFFDQARPENLRAIMETAREYGRY